jgi:hypothetical protein
VAVQGNSGVALSGRGRLACHVANPFKRLPQTQLVIRPALVRGAWGSGVGRAGGRGVDVRAVWAGLGEGGGQEAMWAGLGGGGWAGSGVGRAGGRWVDVRGPY